MPYSQFTIKALIYFNQRKIESQKNMFKKAKNSRCIINLQNLRDCGEEPLLTENEDSEEQNIGSGSKNVESNPLKRSPLRKLIGKVNET